METNGNLMLQVLLKRPKRSSIGPAGFPTASLTCLENVGEEVVQGAGTVGRHARI